MTQLVLENAGQKLLEEVIGFCMDGLPGNLRRVWHGAADKDLLMEAAVEPAPLTIRWVNMPEVTRMVYAAMVGADALGRYFKN